MSPRQAVMAKAHRLLDEGRVHRDEDNPQIFWIDSFRDNRYRVQTDWDSETKTLTTITCTCPSGLLGPADNHCHHIAAALVVLYNEKKEAESHGIE